MKKITIEVEDITLFAKALNNAIIAYGDITWGIFLGCEVPDKFAPLKKLPYEELETRMKCLKDVYRQLEDIERQSREEK